MDFDELVMLAVSERREVCVEDEKVLKEVLERLKRGELKPTLLANPLKGKANLYMPYGDGRIHVRLDGTRVCVHYDLYDPLKDPLKHLVVDTEFAKALLVAAVASIIVAAIKKLQKGRG